MTETYTVTDPQQLPTRVWIPSRNGDTYWDVELTSKWVTVPPGRYSGHLEAEKLQRGIVHEERPQWHGVMLPPGARIRVINSQVHIVGP